VGHAGSELAQRLELLAPAEPLLQALPLGDVADDRREDRLTLHLELGDGDLQRKLFAVLAEPVKLGTIAHESAGDAPGRESLHVAFVPLPGPGGQQDFERPADDLVRRVAEHGLRLLVEQDDALLAVHGEDGVAGRIENALEAGVGRAGLLLGPLALGNVANEGEMVLLSIKLQIVGGYLDRDEPAVFGEMMGLEGQRARLFGPFPPDRPCLLRKSWADVQYLLESSSSLE
jgi:hypothetical protein